MKIIQFFKDLFEDLRHPPQPREPYVAYNETKEFALAQIKSQQENTKKALRMFNNIERNLDNLNDDHYYLIKVKDELILAIFGGRLCMDFSDDLIKDIEDKSLFTHNIQSSIDYLNELSDTLCQAGFKNSSIIHNVSNAVGWYHRYSVEALKVYPQYYGIEWNVYASR